MVERRSITGHTYEQLMACEHRVWLRFHGQKEPHLRADPLALFKHEGIEHEKEVSANQFADATVIPDNIAWPERAAATLDAMRTGAEAILQGVVDVGERRGVADVLERVRASSAHPLGHLYRVGDIKRAETPTTGHVLQLVFYSRVIEQLQGEWIPDGFIISGDGQRHEYSLQEFQDVYDRLDRRILALRDESESRPGPCLVAACRACPWRKACIDELVESEDVTLLPGVTPTRAALLRNAGLSTVDALLSCDSPEAWIQPTEWERLKRAARSWKCHRALLRGPIVPLGLADALLVDVTGSEWVVDRSSAARLHWLDGEVRGAPFSDDAVHSLPGDGAILVHGRDRAELLGEILREQRAVLELNEVVQTAYHVARYTETLEELDLMTRGRRLAEEPDEDNTAPRQRLRTLDRVRDWLVNV